MRILIVDDEKLARERLIRMVETLDGYEVAGIADSGEEAVRQSIRLAPDIVLLDIRMPGMDGMEAGRQLA
ncbi:MAG: LytR/AlgR family response regulator transcription factor, partial [Pseudohongiellaceae bacterium]